MGVSFSVDNYVTVPITPRMLWYIKKNSHNDVIEHFISQKYACLEEGSLLREIAPKASFDLLAAAGMEPQSPWEILPYIAQHSHHESSEYIQSLWRHQEQFHHKGCLWSGLRLPCLCLFSSNCPVGIKLHTVKIFKPLIFIFFNIFNFSSMSNPMTSCINFV